MSPQMKHQFSDRGVVILAFNVNTAHKLLRSPTLRGRLPHRSRVWSKQTDETWKTFFGLRASLRAK